MSKRISSFSLDLSIRNSSASHKIFRYPITYNMFIAKPRLNSLGQVREEESGCTYSDCQFLHLK